MKPAIRNKWVKALRSGKYEQTVDMLKDDGGYCCLGVLRECLPGKFADAEGVSKDPEGGGNGFLPTSVLKFTGLHHATQKTLSKMNDRGDSFEDIANYIEKRL